MLAAAAAAAASPVRAVVRAASHYMTSSGAGHTAAGLLVSGTLLGRGLDHLIRWAAAKDAAHSNSNHNGPPAVDSDLLAALLVFGLAALCDALDGMAARAYDQASSLGVVLDVVADNVLRSALWVAAALLDARLALPALGFVACEWLTLLASQVRRAGGARLAVLIGESFQLTMPPADTKGDNWQRNRSSPAARAASTGSGSGRGTPGSCANSSARAFGACSVCPLCVDDDVYRNHFAGQQHSKTEFDTASSPYRNPLGVLGIGGLFLAPLWPLLRHSFPGWLLVVAPSTDAVPTAASSADLSKRVVRALFEWIGWVVLGGRLLSLAIECHFIWGLVRMLCEEDEQEEEGGSAGGGRSREVGDGNGGKKRRCE